MTIEDAIDEWRENVLVDGGTDWFSDTQAGRLIRQSAKEIADGLRLLRADVFDIIVPAGEAQFSAPDDMLAAPPLSVIVNSVTLTPQRLSVVRQRSLMAPARYPRYYHFDPGESTRVVEFSPPVSAASPVAMRYYKSYDTDSAMDGDEIWEGAYPAFHHLVVLLSGVTTFQGLELYQRAAYFAQRYNEELQKFAAVLGNTNIANMMVPPEQRMDAGRVSA